MKGGGVVENTVFRRKDKEEGGPASLRYAVTSPASLRYVVTSSGGGTVEPVKRTKRKRFPIEDC